MDHATPPRIGKVFRSPTADPASPPLCRGGLRRRLTRPLPVRFNAGAAQAGEPLLLDSVAAVVIGGASLFGGSGTILGTVAGSLVIAVIQYGLVFIDVEPFWQFVAVGVVIIISVLVDQTQRRLGGDRG